MLDNQMKRKKHNKMNKDFQQENTEQTTEFTDNFAGSAPNGQAEVDSPEAEKPTDEETKPESPAEELVRTKDAYLRLMAEYDNFRKRTIREKADLIKNGGEKALTALLPVIDDLERAMQTIEKATDIDAIREGITLIYNKFKTYLTQNGVKPVETASQNFDPELHEAVAMFPAADEAQKGKIVDTVQTGYTLNDKVIRHSKVVVAN